MALATALTAVKMALQCPDCRTPLSVELALLSLATGSMQTTCMLSWGDPGYVQI